MGREFIGDCFTDSELGTYEMKLAIKYIKRKCGRPPRGVDVEITWEGYERASGEETQYPVISAVIVKPTGRSNQSGYRWGSIQEPTSRRQMPG